MSAEPNRLTWALVIAADRREHILPRCLRLAVQQTRPPVEIVVDASPGWERTRDAVLAELVAAHPEMRWAYVADFPDRIFAKSEADLRAWYPDFQKRLLAAHSPPPTTTKGTS